MTPYNIMIVTLDSHHVVRHVFRELIDAGIDVRTYSVIGKDEANYLGQQLDTSSTLSDDLAHVLPDRAALPLSVIGSIVVLGHLVSMLDSVVETMPDRESPVQGLSLLGAALFHYGLSTKSAADCEAAVSTNRVLLIGYGATAEIVHAGSILGAAIPRDIVMYEGV